jgi:hypothetical protein
MKTADQESLLEAYKTGNRNNLNIIMIKITKLNK